MCSSFMEKTEEEEVVCNWNKKGNISCYINQKQKNGPSVTVQHYNLCVRYLKFTVFTGCVESMKIAEAIYEITYECSFKII